MNSVRPLHRPRPASTVRKVIAHLFASAALLGAAAAAQAGADIKLSDDAGINIGMGLRMSYSSVENGAPNGTSRSNDFNVENARLYISGHYGNVMKVTFNTERTGGPAASGGDSIRVMDSIAQFEFMPEFNIWAGRMLPPSDRANLYGPFYALPWSYPGVASNYPNLAVGRDNGVMVWGKPFASKIVYSAGVFEGHNKAAGLSGEADSPAFAGRLAVNLLNPEPAPAHYTGGWYADGKSYFTVAAATFQQKDGVGTAAAKGNLNIWSFDLLAETKLGLGTPTLEGAYYRYNLGALDCGSGEPGAPACVGGADNVGGQVDGKAWLGGLAFLFDQKVGWGQFQPYVRFQQFDRTVSNTRNKQFDVGVNYIIKGPNAKVSLTYSDTDDTRKPLALQKQNMIVLGVQFQY